VGGRKLSKLNKIALITLKALLININSNTLDVACNYIVEEIGDEKLLALANKLSVTADRFEKRVERLLELEEKAEKEEAS